MWSISNNWVTVVSMNMETINQVFARYKREYFEAKASKKRTAQTRIIDIVLNVTSMARNSAIRKFNRIQDKDAEIAETRGRKTYYTPDVTAALKDVWIAGDEVCGEAAEVASEAGGVAGGGGGEIAIVAGQGEDLLDEEGIGGEERGEVALLIENGAEDGGEGAGVVTGGKSGFAGGGEE